MAKEERERERERAGALRERLLQMFTNWDQRESGNRQILIKLAKTEINTASRTAMHKSGCARAAFERVSNLPSITRCNGWRARAKSSLANCQALRVGEPVLLPTQARPSVPFPDRRSPAASEQASKWAKIDLKQNWISPTCCHSPQTTTLRAKFAS